MTNIYVCQRCSGRLTIGVSAGAEVADQLECRLAQGSLPGKVAGRRQLLTLVRWRGRVIQSCVLNTPSCTWGEFSDALPNRAALLVSTSAGQLCAKEVDPLRGTTGQRLVPTAWLATRTWLRLHTCHDHPMRQCPPGSQVAPCDLPPRPRAGSRPPTSRDQEEAETNLPPL